MAVVNIGAGAKPIKIAKPKYILVQPWNGSTPPSEDEAAKDIYSFDNVLRDSTSLTQDDNETNTIENELSDDPIRTNVTLGSRTFSTTVEDIQEDLLVELAGYKKDGDKVYAPASYTDLYAEVTIVLDKGMEEEFVAIILPKVQLNTKMLLESLSSSMVGVQVTGTVLSTTVKGSDDVEYTTGQYIDYKYPKSKVEGTTAGSGTEDEP